MEVVASPVNQLCQFIDEARVFVELAWFLLLFFGFRANLNFCLMPGNLLGQIIAGAPDIDLNRP